MPTRNDAAVELRGARAVVTGGAGLIGSHICDELVNAGAAEIVVVDNFVRGSRANLAWAVANGPVTIVDGDIRDRALIDEVMQDTDVVFHQAAIRITQCADEPRLALDVLVGGTFNVVESAAKTRVRKIVAASSASIYGLADAFPTAEQHHPYNNRTLYGAAKSFGEGLMRSFHEMHRLDYVALRYFNVYGPRMDVFGAYTEIFIRWMERIAVGRPPVIFGDGRQTIDFVNVADIARANLRAAAAPVSDEVFNIGNGTETTLLELADLMLEIMESPLRPEHVPERKANPVPRRRADIDKARRMLDFEPTVGLEDGLRRLVAWWQEAQCET